MPRPQGRNVLSTNEKPRKAGVAKAEGARAGGRDDCESHGGSSQTCQNYISVAL